jgi:NADH-quinone oxidoreductase subunit L
MSLFFLLPFISLSGGLLTLVYHFKKENTNLLSNVFIFISLVLSLALLQHLGIKKTYSILFFNNNELNLSVKLQIDNLTIIMLVFINFISFIIHKYSTYYMSSDITQGRFMAQLSILTATVSFLVMSGNLLTAFIAWQFIGLSLYLLLNHYHYNDYANKAAKKKFIINQLGDLSFLSAVILAYKYCGNSDFNSIVACTTVYSSSLITVHISTIISILIFIAVMTKSAQFPFHIWLPDTMETPTPVSAIMHAGVINAGGLLLTRISPIINLSVFTSNFIFTIGIVTIVTGTCFMLTQSDIKKQLAYSTMGQMGFMIVQCSLGIYAAAIFHLIAHGFFKGFLFLNAGNNLKRIPTTDHKQLTWLNKIRDIIIFLLLCLLFSRYFLSINHFNSANLISLCFIALTLTNIISEIFSVEYKKIEQLLLISIMVLLTLVYYYCSELFIGMIAIPNNNIELHKFDLYKLSITLVLIILQILIWIKPKVPILANKKINLYFYHLIRNQLFVEELYRKIFLNPFRKFGDFLNHIFAASYGRFIFLGMIAYLMYITFSGMYHDSLSIINILSCQLIFIILVASANRAFNIRMVSINFFIAQIAFMDIGLYTLQPINLALFIFQLINSLLIFLSIQIIISTTNPSNNLKYLEKNRLHFSNMYFCILLFLLIGLPGTATFISEISILYSLSKTNGLLIIMTIIGLIMLAIAILHVLQDHVFSSENKKSLVANITPMNHLFIIITIVFNIFNGINPNWLLTKLN